MQHLSINDVAHRLVRQVACVGCSQRPRGSEALPPAIPRACEPTCPLFAHLPGLMSLVRQVGDRPGDCERAVFGNICSGCRLKPTAGDFCADYAARECPLSRYSSDVVAALQIAFSQRPGEGQEGPP